MGATDSVSNDPERLHWNPTKECMFGAMIVIITLMVVLLLKNSCSKVQLRPQPNPQPPPRSWHSEWPEQAQHVENKDVAASDEVFVIMAGQQKPSFLAKPVASTTQPCEQV